VKQISRELHVSRNTVRNILTTGETEFTYEPEVQPMPKLGDWTGELDRLLTSNEGKASTTS
jgi:orotate phosphoribosyltransferase-like protein